MHLEIALAGSATLYHLIDLKHATTALKNDRLRLAPVNKAEAELGTRGSYFLSTARSPSSDYIVNGASYGNKVIFVLDGTKIGHNYAVEPVNYWHKNPHDNRDEKEDRVYANKPYMPLIKYVKEVHFIADARWNGSDTLPLLLICKRNKLPTFQYEAWEDLVSLRKKAAIKTKPTKTVVKLGSGFGVYETGYDSEALWKMIRTDFKKHHIIENGLPSRSATVQAGAKGTKSKQARRKLLDWIRNMTPAEFDAIVTNRATPLAEKYSDKITQYMRKKRLTATELILQLRENWK